MAASGRGALGGLIGAVVGGSGHHLGAVGAEDVELAVWAPLLTPPRQVHDVVVVAASAPEVPRHGRAAAGAGNDVVDM